MQTKSQRCAAACTALPRCNWGCPVGRRRRARGAGRRAQNHAAYAGRASLKTWLFAILKNKIADILRSRHRMQSTDPAQAMTTTKLI